MFIEGLVPALVAAAVGLGLLTVALRPFREYIRNSPDEVVPYWLTEGALAVSPGVVVYAAVIATIAAVIIGVLPGLKATGRRVQPRLQQFSARGAGMQLGGTWTALIVLQVAVAVAALPPALYTAERAYRVGVREAPSAFTPLLRATLAMSPDVASSRAEGVAPFSARMVAWLETLESEPGVSAVSYADRFPGEEASATVETDGEAPGPVTMRAHPSRVATNFFDVLGIRILAGRTFTPSDAHPGATAVVVDQTFADRLGHANILGRRIRSADLSPGASPEDTRWFEVVGVVPAFAATVAPSAGFRDPLPRIYHATPPGDVHPAAVIVRVSSGDPTHFAERLRHITASVHPTLKLHRLAGVVQDMDREKQVLRAISFALVAVTGSVLLLSAAGIYALMSFTVARRRREIGIRAALGADARRVLIGIFGRATAQIGAGVAIGLACVAALDVLAQGDVTGGRGHVLLPTVAAVMFVVGILAAAGPARRGLAVQPIDALREE
jgi:putative ABC transport system permease protein